MGTKIPYELIHQLEDQYGSLLLVPNDNLILQKIQNFFINFDDGRSERKAKKDTYLENKIVGLVEAGYLPGEIQSKLKVGVYRVRKVFHKYGLRSRPQFKYVAANMKTGQLIYAKSYAAYDIVTGHAGEYWTHAQRLLREAGYKSHKYKIVVRWSRLQPGDQYIIGKKIYTKR